MALHALGSITVASDGTVTKSGECEEVYDLLYADLTTAASEAGSAVPTGPDSVPFKKGIARLATTIATYVHGALTTRAKAEITTGTSGLQRMSDPVAADADTQGPSNAKYLGIV